MTDRLPYRNCTRRGNWRNLDFKEGGGGGMMVKDVIYSGVGVGVCLNVCAGFHTKFRVLGKEKLQSSVLT